ncbi:MAG: BppU family phage baseplate upper protein [Eubacteriales bacterium]
MTTLAHTDELTLDLSALPVNRSDVTLYAKQEDSVRRVEITLQENGENYTIPDGVSVMLRALKPDGHFVLTDCPFEKQYVYLYFPREMLTCAGTVRAEICLTVGEEILSSATFYVEVLPGALSDIPSTNELSALSKALDAAAILAEQALAPVAVETVLVGDGFDPSGIAPDQHATAPIWKDGAYRFDDGDGTQFSQSHSAYSAGYLYFFDSDDHTSYCKLIGNYTGCTGFIRYRPLGITGGLGDEFRKLLDGETVEGRALLNEDQVKKLTDLTSRFSITANSTRYYMIEMTMYATLYMWADYFINYLYRGKTIDFGDGVQRRFVTTSELEEIDRRLTALGG